MISSLHRMAAAREKNMITITFRDEICSNFLFNAIIYVPRIFFHFSDLLDLPSTRRSSSFLSLQ
jgi:hypothetical protein